MALRKVKKQTNKKQNTHTSKKIIQRFKEKERVWLEIEGLSRGNSISKHEQWQRKSHSNKSTATNSEERNRKQVEKTGYE